MKKIILMMMLVIGGQWLMAQETLTTEEPKKPVVPAPTETIEKTDYDTLYPVKRTMSLGVVGGYAVDFHSADAMTLPDVPSCCPGYDGGTGGGFLFALALELPISSSIELVTLLSYHGSNVTMTVQEPITVRDGNSTRTANITHELTSSLTFVSLEPAVEFRLGERFGLIGGVRLGTLIGATYEEQEILDPSIPYDYQGGSGVRNQSLGDITGTSSFQFGLLLGARYRLPMNADGTLMLIPEAQFVPMFSSVLADQTWTVSSLRFMIGVSYALTSRVREDSPLRPGR